MVEGKIETMVKWFKGSKARTNIKKGRRKTEVEEG